MSGGNEKAVGRVPITEVGRVLLRWSWLVVGAGVVVGAVAYLAERPPDGYRAESSVTLGSDVFWPFYDATRQRVLELGDEELEAAVAADVAAVGSVSSLTVDAPLNQAYLTLSVQASTAEAALQGADRAAELLVERANTTGASVVAAERLAEVEGYLAEAEQAVAEAQAAWDAAVVVEEQANAVYEQAEFGERADEEAAATRARVARQQAEEVLFLAVRERNDLEQQQADLARDAAGTSEDLQLLRAAELEDRAEDTAIAVALVGAVTAMIVASLLALVLERRFGRVRSSAALRAVAGMPVLSLRDERAWEAAAITIADLVATGRTRVGFTGPDETAAVAIERLTAMLDRGDPDRGWRSAGVIVPRATVRGLDLVSAQAEVVAAVHAAVRDCGAAFVDLGDHRSWTFDLAAAHVDAAVLVVVKGRTTYRRVDSARGALEDRGAQPVLTLVMRRSDVQVRQSLAAQAVPVP